MKYLRCVIQVTVIVVIIGLLSSCGVVTYIEKKQSYSQLATEKAEEAMNTKYGIQAKAESVEILDKDGNWILVTMKDGKKTFEVLVTNVETRDYAQMDVEDNYEKETIQLFLENYVKDSMRSSGLPVPSHVRVGYSHARGFDLNYMVRQKFTNDLSFFGEAVPPPVAVLDYCEGEDAYAEARIYESTALTNVFDDFMVLQWQDSTTLEKYGADEEVPYMLPIMVSLPYALPYLEGYVWKDGEDENDTVHTVHRVGDENAFVITLDDSLDGMVSLQVVDKKLKWKWDEYEAWGTFEQRSPIYEVSVDESVKKNDRMSSYLYVSDLNHFFDIFKEIRGGVVNCEQGNYSISENPFQDDYLGCENGYYVFNLMLYGGYDQGACLLAK